MDRQTDRQAHTPVENLSRMCLWEVYGNLVKSEKKTNTLNGKQYVDREWYIFQLYCNWLLLKYELQVIYNLVKLIKLLTAWINLRRNASWQLQLHGDDGRTTQLHTSRLMPLAVLRPSTVRNAELIKCGSDGYMSYDGRQQKKIVLCDVLAHIHWFRNNL